MLKEPIIIRNELTTYRARLLCPVCTEPRELVWDGLQLLSYPAQYRHECKTCGYAAVADKSYPTVEYQ